MQTHNTSVFDDSYFAPSYNVAPQSLQPLVRLDSETGEHRSDCLSKIPDSRADTCDSAFLWRNRLPRTQAKGSKNQIFEA
jgi:hypothetical protein